MSTSRLTILLVIPLLAIALATPEVSLAGRDAKGKTQLMCLNHDGSSYRSKQEPKQCAVLGPGASFGGGMNLKQIHWSSWGRSAKGEAIECGFHLPCQDLEATVRLSRPRERCGRLVYTKIKVKTDQGKATPPLATCPGSPY